MKKFQDFNIDHEHTAFVGDKIKLERLLNCEIIVHAYKLEPSKQREGEQCLTLQVEKSGQKHVVFTGAKVLIKMISQVPDGGMPFTTTIIKDNEYYEFT